MKRFFQFSALLISALLLSAPFLSLILPEKLRAHTYRELITHVIAIKESKGVNSATDIAKILFFYTAKNTLLNPGDTTPYDGKALDYLINGLVYCDYQADILATLCAHRGIPARYCMLMDKNGVSPHTVTEISLRGKWGVFDIAEVCYYTTQAGEFADLEDLSRNPNLIFNNKRWLMVKRESEEQYNNKVNYYKRMFPVPLQPQRSSSKIKRITIFDRMGFVYYGIFKDMFLRPYQDRYLKIRTKNMKDIERLYYKARNYQLAYRSDEAISAYKDLIRLYPDNPYFKKSVIFLAFVYMDRRKDYPRAIKTLSILISGSGSPYEKYALYYTGKCYRLLGQERLGQEYIDRSRMFAMLEPAFAN